mmetsp:Transcript_19167/g.37656  ORF Transcript_19167/g.37656 Transcript_19167/m.37656 type:complete len:94 (-) Transcript_19167:20-301(-)
MQSWDPQCGRRDPCDAAHTTKVCAFTGLRADNCVMPFNVSPRFTALLGNTRSLEKRFAPSMDKSATSSLTASSMIHARLCWVPSELAPKLAVE